MAARFRAMSSSSGGGATIIVTYNSRFYNKTMTCSDGTTTYTKTTTSSGSTEFDVKDEGTWTITCDGVSRTVDVVLNYSTQMAITKTITVYGAASDTISFTDETGAKTVTTNASGQGSVSITYLPPSQNITFTSSIAKDPSDLSQAYSKTIAINSSTTSITVVPDNALYWFGNECTWLTGGWTTSGYQYGSQTNEGVTLATNYIPLTKPSGNGHQRNYGTVNTVNVSGKTKLKIIKAYSGGSTDTLNITISDSGLKYIAANSENYGGSYWQNFVTKSSSKSLTGSDFVWNDHVNNVSASAMNIYAIWLE